MMNEAARHNEAPPPSERRAEGGRERSKADVFRELVDAFREADRARVEAAAGAVEVERAAEQRGGELTPEERRENAAVVVETDRAANEQRTAIREIEREAAVDPVEVERRMEKAGIEGDAASFMEKHPKTWELRLRSKEMAAARERLAAVEAKLKKFEGLGALRGLSVDARTEKIILEEELEDAKREYAEIRAEYVGEKAGRMLKERHRVADARAEEVAKEKGIGTKVYDAYKTLGELNLTKLGWQPTSRVGKIVARAVSVRTGIGLGLVGAGFALGAGAAAGAAAIMARRVMAGMGAAFGSYDLMRMVAERRMRKFDADEMAEMPTDELNERMEKMEADAMIAGKPIGQDEAYAALRAELGKRLGGKELSLADMERAAGPEGRIGSLMAEADRKLDEMKKKGVRNDRLMKGAAAAIGVFIGSGTLAKAVRAAGERLGVGEALDTAKEYYFGKDASAAPAESAAITPAGETVVEQAPDASAEKALALAEVRKGEGFTQVIARQLEADPARFGYDPAKHGPDVRAWAVRTSVAVAKENHLLAPHAEMRIAFHPDRPAHVILNDDLSISQRGVDRVPWINTEKLMASVPPEEPPRIEVVQRTGPPPEIVSEPAHEPPVVETEARPEVEEAPAVREPAVETEPEAEPEARGDRPVEAADAARERIPVRDIDAARPLPSPERLARIEALAREGGFSYNGVKFGMIDGKLHYEMPGGGARVLTPEKLAVIDRYTDIVKHASSMSEDELDARIKQVAAELHRLEQAAAPVEEVRPPAEPAAEPEPEVEGEKDAAPAEETSPRPVERQPEARAFYTADETKLGQSWVDRGATKESLQRLADAPAVRGRTLELKTADGGTIRVAGGIEAKRAARLALERMQDGGAAHDAGHADADAGKPAKTDVPEKKAAAAPERPVIDPRKGFAFGERMKGRFTYDDQGAITGFQATGNVPLGAAESRYLDPHWRDALRARPTDYRAKWGPFRFRMGYNRETADLVRRDSARIIARTERMVRYIHRDQDALDALRRAGKHMSPEAQYLRENISARMAEIEQDLGKDAFKKHGK